MHVYSHDCRKTFKIRRDKVTKLGESEPGWLLLGEEYA